MTTGRFFLASVALLLVHASTSAAVETTLYVAPGGNDANPGTQAQPFATLEKARQAVRAVNQQMQGDMVVVLRGGTYRIDRSLVFGPEIQAATGTM